MRVDTGWGRNEPRESARKEGCEPSNYNFKRNEDPDGGAIVGGFLVLVPFVSGLASLILSFVLFGTAMAGVFIGWSIGPLHFAPDGQGHLYVAVHFSAVGIRSLIAPFLGYAVKNALDSYRAGFWAAAVFLLAGAITIARLSRRVR